MAEDLLYSATTKDVNVQVRPIFLEDQSDPSDDHYVWAYQIKIENQSAQRVQLLRRHWQITDARGLVEVVDGDGVVGEQPVLEPGESFEYTSGAPLKTPSGFMMGHYQMEASQGEFFEVEVPAFSLDSPYDHVVHH